MLREHMPVPRPREASLPIAAAPRSWRLVINKPSGKFRSTSVIAAHADLRNLAML
jgi:hypothetical protein